MNASVESPLMRVGLVLSKVVSETKIVVIFIGASERHIPIVDDEGCNFFYIDGKEPVSCDSFFLHGRPW